MRAASRFHLATSRCIAVATGFSRFSLVGLEPLTVLIGENDTGKTASRGSRELDAPYDASSSRVKLDIVAHECPSLARVR